MDIKNNPLLPGATMTTQLQPALAQLSQAPNQPLAVPPPIQPHPRNYMINYDKSSEDMEADQVVQEDQEDQEDQGDQEDLEDQADLTQPHPNNPFNLLQM